MKTEKIVNITPNASADALKRDLENEARKWGLPARELVAKIYTYAVAHQDEFRSPIKRPRKSGGEHIGTSVSDSVGRQLKEWSEEKGSPRGIHCCYILEKALENGTLNKILSISSKPKAT